jgi:hypothetical protein
MEDNALYGITWAADGKGFFATSEKPGSFSLLHVTLAVARSNPCYAERTPGLRTSRHIEIYIDILSRSA